MKKRQPLSQNSTPEVLAQVAHIVLIQNPADPDATYSAKAGKRHIGYAANVVEAVSGEGSVITDYQYGS